MKTLYMTKGLPASGKTTAAKALVATQPGTKRVNKDDLRAMLDNGKWSEANERFILGVRDRLISDILDTGCHVICDDTNLAPKHETQLRQIAKAHKAAFEILDHTHVQPEECITRDLVRPNSVGQKVILDMYDRYLKPAPALAPAWNMSLPAAVICDIDGTIAEMNGRSPYDWSRVDEDLCRHRVLSVVLSFVEDRGQKLVFVTGRDERCREKTKEWLNRFLGEFYELHMRPAEDTRRDSIVKREIYENHIKDRYNVNAIFDDRPQVIRECWQALGFGDRIFNVGTGEEF